MPLRRSKPARDRLFQRMSVITIPGLLLGGVVTPFPGQSGLSPTRSLFILLPHAARRPDPTILWFQSLEHIY